MNEHHHHLIKAATRDLIKLTGGLERASSIASISTTQLSRWQSPHHADLITLSAALALEAECGVPLVTRAMAESTGHRVVSADAEHGDVTSLLAVQATMMEAQGLLAGEVARALADGRVTPTEAESIRRVAGVLEEGLTSLRAAVARVKADGGADVVAIKGGRT